MQMKKTHDAAMVLIERVYGERPRFNYYIGTSQGGREALTVAQRYPADYDGIAANVPIVELLDADAGARADSHPREAAGQLGDAGQDQRDPRRVHAPVRRARRPGRRHHQQLHGVPRDLRRRRRARRTAIRGRRSAARTTSIRIRRTRARSACLTDGQISTLEFIYPRYTFATPLANGAQIVRHVGAEHRSVGQRADRSTRVPGTGRRGGGRADALAPRRPRRDRLPDEEICRPTRSTTSKAARSIAAASELSRDPRRDQPGSRARSRSAAAR